MFFIVFSDLVAIRGIKLSAKLGRSTYPLKFLPWRKNRHSTPNGMRSNEVLWWDSKASFL